MPLLPLLLLACSGLARGKRVVIDNTQPRLGTDGAIINSHDGTIRWLEGRWWVHAAS